jgi:hypothetical protein
MSSRATRGIYSGCSRSLTPFGMTSMLSHPPIRLTAYFSIGTPTLFPHSVQLPS